MLLLHIGTHKTGTTALQRFLVDNQGALAGLNHRYAAAGRPVGRYAQHNLARRGDEEGHEAPWGQLAEEMGERAGVVHLVSSEAFWNVSPEVAARHSRQLGEVKVVAYVRRQDNFLESLYKHNIKLGASLSFEEFFQKRKKIGDYLSVLEKWEALFGRENLVVRPYDTPSGSIDIIADFLTLLGIDPKGEFARPPRSNSSPRVELVNVIRAANRTEELRLNDRLFAELRQRNRAYARSGDLLSLEQRQRIVDHFAEANAEMARRYFPAEVKEGFPPPKALSLPVWPVESEEFYQLLVDTFEVMAKAQPKGGDKLMARERRIQASLD
ncbi:MAG TPA: hypothetical protein VF559_13145 [Caulobacteraceae bacterium]